MHRIRNHDESALLSTILSSISNSHPDFELLHHPDMRNGHLLAVKFPKTFTEQDYQALCTTLERKNLFNSYDGLHFSAKDNGIFIDLSGFTHTPVHRNTASEHQGSAQSEMELYINIDNYNRFEEGHPGYQEMMDGTLNATLATFKDSGNICEIGAGTGNFTRRISPKARVTAVEIDPGCISYLQHKMGTGEITNTTLVTDDFLRWASASDQSFDAVNTTFADHHFSPKQKGPFLQHIKKLLKDGAEYILGDEFLPPHDESDPKARVTAQLQYHGMIIEEAYKEGKVELPNLEFDALSSGLRTTVKFIQQTVLEQEQNEFRVRLAATNGYNQQGAEHLQKLIKRLKAIDMATLPNPEDLPEIEIATKRLAFLSKLEALVTELQESRRPGLQEDASLNKMGGDYKMTIRQFTEYLANAGFKAIGYFEGPKVVGELNDPLDHGKAQQAIDLSDKQDHAGGIWVIRALQDKVEKLHSTHVETSLAV